MGRVYPLRYNAWLAGINLVYSLYVLQGLWLFVHNEVESDENLRTTYKSSSWIMACLKWVWLNLYLFPELNACKLTCYSGALLFFLAIYYTYNACNAFLNSCNAFRSLWDWTAEHCEPNGSSYGTFIRIHNLHLCHKQSLKYLFGLAFSLCLFFFTADATKFVWDCLNQDDDELLGLLGNQTPLRDCRDFFADLGGTKLFVRPITIATTLECIA